MGSGSVAGQRSRLPRGSAGSVGRSAVHGHLLHSPWGFVSAMVTDAGPQRGGPPGSQGQGSLGFTATPCGVAPTSPRGRVVGVPRAAPCTSRGNCHRPVSQVRETKSTLWEAGSS